MKKMISILLSAVLLFSMLSTLSVFAEETYPPLTTGQWYSENDLTDYSFETAGENPQPISLSDSYIIQVQRESRIIDLNDEVLEEQIKEDYSAFINNEVSADELGVDYYGTLSDGSMLVFITGPFMYATVPNYRVIGKYVYVTSSSGNDIEIYKNGTFTSILDAYQSGELSDELLDETAQILCFAKFVNPNGETETEATTAPATTESGAETTVESTSASTENTTSSSDVVETTSVTSETEPTEADTTVTETSNVSTADSAVRSTQDSGGSVQTGNGNAVFLCLLALSVSGMIFCIVKNKRA